MLGARSAEVSVDGGVKVEHVSTLVAHGAGTLVAGSAIFGAPDPAAVIARMREAAST
jgi:ribulose-phosphate 3-epimerase